MELHDLDLNLLVVFNQLMVDKRVSIVAQSLGLTQPAVSNALKRLRTALQDELFVRTHQGMEPTPYAAHLAEPIAHAMHSLREALHHEERFDPLTSERTFTLAMTDIGEIYFMPRLIDALARKDPPLHNQHGTRQLGEFGTVVTRRYSRFGRRPATQPTGRLLTASASS